MGIADALHSVQERANTMPNPEEFKAATLNKIHGCYETIRGSGSVMTELGNVTHACLDLPAGAVGGALKAVGQLCTLQPINATCTAGKALVDTCQNLGKIAVSPVPIALAAAENSLSVAKKVAKLPIKAPIAAYRVAERGVNRVLDLFGPSAGTTSKSPDLGGAQAAAPSAPTAM